MYDIIALGESLIDFTPAGISGSGTPLFACNPGGAPANVLAMFVKLGGTAGFIGKVGRDIFGTFLQQIMQHADIDTRGLRFDDRIPTTLAFVHLAEDGDRSFSFYRKPGADIMLRFDEVEKKLLSSCRFFHFGGVSLTDEPCRTATIESVKAAKTAGAYISYDPNYRPLLWDDEKRAIRALGEMVTFADVLKVSDSEAFLLTGCEDLLECANALLAMGPHVVFVTCGEAGALVCTKGGQLTVPPLKVDAIDTTGAGDAFLGSMLYQISAQRISDLAQIELETWAEMVRFSNVAGGLTTTRMGAIPALPTLEQIKAALKEVGV